MRRDLHHKAMDYAWAGSGSIPFGMFDCPGWIKPITRLTVAIAAINRSACRHGSTYKIINIRPFGYGGYFLCSASASGPLSHALAARHVERARRICSRLCQECGKPARPLYGGVWCHAHAPSHSRIESIFDARRIKRHGIGLAKHIGARITGKMIYSLPGSLKFRMLIEPSGQPFVRLLDAPAGSRGQVLETANGIKYEAMPGEWIIEVNSRHLRLDQNL